ncbi:Bromodomain-containing protein 1 [Nosema granulosis]|uniref:Bromodomain-containing protein 1 n=1 Tax=Nosema granulosis TaxID=83296 RepID=A0A9P6H074_9MICR|nr:Bromodomain-containing protein 1 [Nosema granulosis]
MSKTPREEISYTKIYKNLDLEKKHKISNTAPTQTLNKDVRYCLDDFDLQFLEEIKKQLSIEIEPEAFEFVIDRLEKEWHSILQKQVDENFSRLLPEDCCDICTFPESGENIIIVCQGCGISVHRDCYGSSYDRDEVFICLSCTYIDKNPVCMFCGSEDGIMKLTTDCRWGHLTCVLFDETLDFDNPHSREPIDITKYIENKSVCIFCKNDQGTTVHCSYGYCPNTYHVSCGLSKTYFDVSNLVSYCEEHNPLKVRSLFSTSNVFLKNVAGYKKLNLPPAIRKLKGLSKRKQTIVTEIYKTEPYVSVSILNEILSNGPNQKIIEIICAYWKLRKSENSMFLLNSLRLRFD